MDRTSSSTLCVCDGGDGEFKDFLTKAIARGYDAGRKAGLEKAMAGLKVSNEKLQWALDELGPVGDNVGAYLKAAVEYVIWLRAESEKG